MEIIAVSSAGERVEMSMTSEGGEKERVFGVEEIDRGEFGAVFHPLTGQKLSDLNLVFDDDESRRCWVFGLPVIGGYGWGEEIPASVKKLQRIGDSMAHKKNDFPLPHWHFDPYTGEELRK